MDEIGVLNKTLVQGRHREMVAALCKPGKDILTQLTPDDAHLLHMAGCVCGEAGELWDAIKNKVIYRQPLDRANVVEELGDIEFYLEGLRACLMIRREETLLGNMEKLSKRYASRQYSDQQARERADKDE